MKKYIYLLPLILGIILPNLAKAQVPTCGSDVPYFQVDLTGQPDGTWITPSHARKGNCCGTTSPDRCTSFEIILDPGAAMINFEIASGAIPPGSMFYQIDCGPQVAVGDPICISGVGPHYLTFCKPGNNENTYAVTSIAQPIIPDDDSTRIGCSLPLNIYGLENISINAIDPDPSKVTLYNSYLSCTDCAQFDFSPGAGAPAYIDYEICGTPAASICGYIFTCDTVRLYAFSALNGSVNPNPAEFCSGGPGVTLTAAGTGGDGNFVYNWWNSSNVNIGSGSTYNATSQETFTAEISDGLNSPTCPSKFISVPVTVGLPPVVNAGTDQTVCANDPEIVLNGTVSNASGGIWSGGSGTFDPSNTSLLASYTPTTSEIASGSVTLTLTSTGAGGGCTDDFDQVVISFSDTTDITFTTPTLLCNGDAGTLTANVSNGTAPYTYVWSDGATANFTTADAGAYWVDVTDNLGCIHRESITLTDPSALNISLTSTDVSVNGGSDGTATATVSGGTPGYTYSWSSGGTTALETGLSYGVVEATVTDANGCVISSSIVVNEPQCSSFSASAISTDVTCYGGNDGTASAAAVGGTPGYNYSWNTSPVTLGPVATGLTAGAYTVTVTDAGSCIDVATVTIIEPTQLENNMTHVDNTAIGGTAGEATANPAGGTPGYNYSWTPGGATTQTITNLAAGTYYVDIQDANLCSISDSVQIDEPPCNNFNIGVTTTNVSCFWGTDGEASLTIVHGTAPYTINWSDGQTGMTATGLVAGTYSVSVTDASNCTNFATFSITEPSILDVGLSATGASCYGYTDGTIDLSVTGGVYPYTYEWSVTGGEIIGYSEDLVKLGQGTYSVLVTDANGCAIESSVGVTQPSQLNITASKTNATCEGYADGAIDITPTGGVQPYSYSWTSGQNTQDISGLTAGLYTVLLTDANSCVAKSSTYIDEPNPVVIELVSADCPNPGETTTMVTVDSVTGGDETSYDISYDNGSTYNGLGNYSISLPIGSTYQIVAMDGNGCLSPSPYTLTIDDAVVIDSVTFNPCFATGTTTIPVTVYPNGGAGGPFEVSVDNGVTFGTAGTTVFNLAVGTSHQIVVRDVNGCRSTATTITIPSEITVTPDINTEVSCLGENDGSITLDVAGGVSPYTYAWTGPSAYSATTKNINSLYEGTYDVTVTDNNGCTGTGSITMTTVVDATIPTITCPSDVTANNDNGSCGAIVTYTAPVGTDECPLGTHTTLTAGLPSGDFFIVGTTTVTYTVADSVGNSASCSFNVTVNDVEMPSITCPADVSVNPDPNSCSATGVSLGTPTTADNCGVLSTSNDAPSSFPNGNTTVTWTVTDIHGNTNTCTQTVTVTDAELPTITCPAPVSVTADPGLCSASGVSLGTPTTNDNCTVASVTNDAPSTFPVGTTTVTWTVTDAAGNSATCTQDVTVTDDEDPIITCAADVTVYNDPGNCSTDAANVGLGNPSTSDNCGVATVTNNAPATYPVGNTTVTWIVTDIHGNTATCAQVVTVIDNEDPVIASCAAPVTQTADPGVCQATGVSLGSPTVTDNCGVATVTNDAPSAFPVGTTTVTWTITDVNGNSITCTQDVTITDDEDPTISCPAPVSITADPGLCSASGVALGTPTTNDNCGVATVTNDAPSTFPVGSTTVTWTVTDIHGNSTSCTQTVTVTDDENPVITCAADVTVNNDPANCSTDAANVSLGNPSTSDNCGVATVTNNAPATYPVGTTNVTWTVTDIHGNTATCTQVVTVIDNEDPVIASCAAPVTQTADPGVCQATGVSLGSPTVTDNCGVATVTNDAPSAFPVGTTTVTWTITDIHGNSITCTQDVTITDDEDPTISCPAPVSITADPGLCSATGVALGTPTTNDNCGVAAVTNDAPSTFPVGSTTVTWTVTDIHGNSTSCTQDVTVTDDEDPVITCPGDVTVYNDPANCSTDAANVSLGNPTTTDNCGVATVTNNAPATFPVGNTTVTWTVTDIHGNTSSCTQIVTVVDNEAPVVVSCAADITQSPDPGICGSTSIFLGNPTVTDNCGVATVTNDAPSFFPVGTTTVTWTITDIHGNVTTCEQDVTVVDDEDPFISCPSAVTVMNDAEVCFASNVSLGTPIASDNCSVASITNDAPATFPVGTTTVTWTATDQAGNTATCTQDVVVIDNESPVIACAANVTLSNDPGNCSTDSINVTLNAPNVLDNCGIDTVYSDAPSVYPVGTTNVTWTAVDIHGNSSSCVQTVTIEDNEEPVVVSCAAPVSVTADPSVCGATGVSLGTPTVTDNCGVATVTNDAPSFFPVGTTTVTWTITDIHGNSITCTQEVTVTDDEDPVINCPATTIVSSDPGFCYATNVSLGNATVSDNCGVATITNNAPSIYPVGTTVVTWVVTDIHNNTDTCYQDVVVEDNEAPTLTNCQADTASCNPVLYYQAPTANDNCGIASIEQVSGYGPGATFPVGTTTEVWEITDIHGNISYCSFDVTIHPLPLPSLATTDVSCYSFGDGEIATTMLDGTAPFTFAWSNGETTQDITGLVPGSYDVLVTDVFGCQGSASASITQPDTLNVESTFSQVSCYGLTDGGVDITVSGGTTPYTYSWSNGDISQDLTNVGEGNYSVTVTDFNSCTYDLSVYIGQPDSLIATGTVVDAICEGANGEIDLTVDGGRFPYSYLWSNGDTSQDLDSATLGIYSVVVTDANGCTVNYLDTIGSYSVMSLGRDIYHPLCYGDNGAIDLTVIDGTAPYTFTWSTGDTTQNLDSISAGTYSVTVVDANLCAQSATFEVVQPDSLELEFYVSEYEGGYGVSGYAQEDGEIDMTIYGGTEPYDIQWVPNSNDEDLYDLGAGEYFVTVVDNNGCTANGEVIITQPMDLEIPTGFTPNDDGYNDYFVIRGVEGFPDNELLIYNRWGNLVYSKVGYLNEWDGLNNDGQMLPDGTYFVVFEIKSGNLDNINIEIPYSGYVDLRRTR